RRGKQRFAHRVNEHSQHEVPIARRAGNEKAPCEQRWGSKTAPLLAKSAISAAREGSLAYGCAADYSGGTAADLHALPRCPCLQKLKDECMPGVGGSQFDWLESRRVCNHLLG